MEELALLNLWRLFKLLDEESSALFQLELHADGSGGLEKNGARFLSWKTLSEGMDDVGKYLNYVLEHKK